MNIPRAIDRKRYVSFPPRASEPGRARRALRNLWAMAVLPYTLPAARMRGTPGMGVRMRCIAYGLRGLASGHARHAFALVANPMDSFRYFEVDFVRRVGAELKPTTYLDVSSPRLVPLSLLDVHKGLVADIINPIAEDLADTAALARTLGLEERCRMQQVLIEDADYEEASFDLVTSISVVEHIPGDREAVARMWRLLRPGGRLLITVPCAREACEEYTNFDEYALFESEPEGFVYWQRYYDEAALAERIWSVTGRPRRTFIYGEIEPGNYDRNVVRKRTDPTYPFWREPLMMAREYRFFDTIDALPGMGVVAMEFEKPVEANHG